MLVAETDLRRAQVAGFRAAIAEHGIARLMAQHPKLGQGRKDRVEPSIRFWPVAAYLIVYQAVRTPIEILAVVHGARDVPAIVNRRAK